MTRPDEQSSSPYGAVSRALVEASRPLPSRVLVLDERGGDLALGLAAEGIEVVAIVATDEAAVAVRDRARALDLAGKLEIRVGDPLSPVGIARQRSLFELASARRQVELLEGGPWPLVVADVRAEPLSTDERRGLRPWFASARGHFPREVVLIERAAGLCGETGRLVVACRPDLFAREFGVLLSERVLAPRGPHLVIDGRAADPPRVVIAEELDPSRGDRAIRPRVGVPAPGRWNVLIDGLRDPNHPWVNWRAIPAGLSDPADALDSQQSRDLLDAIAAGARQSGEDLLASMPGRTTACGFRDVWVATPGDATRPMLTAGGLRDWQITATEDVFWPYERPGRALGQLPSHLLFRLALHRPLLEARRVFGDRLDHRGLKWFEHVEHYPARIEAPFRVACATRGTHNHAAMIHDAQLLTSSSNLVIPARDEESAFLLLGLLNSSLVCFWAKHSVAGTRQIDLTAGQLLDLPIPAEQVDLIVSIARKIDRLSRQPGSLVALMSGADAERIEERLEAERSLRSRIDGELVWWQEELDWAVYAGFGLVRRTDSDTLPQPMRPEQRPFVSASHHPGRAALIEHDPRIRAIERANYKRPFAARDFDEARSDAAHRALFDRLLARLERGRFQPIAPLKRDFVSDPVVILLVSMTDASGPEAWFEASLEQATLPLEPAAIYTATGWAKFVTHMRRCVAAARREAGDHGESIAPIIWDRDDFRTERAWQIRGRNDVRQERLIRFETMKTFEGDDWLAAAPETALELAATIASADEVLERYGFYRPEPRGGPAAAVLGVMFGALELVRSVLEAHGAEIGPAHATPQWWDRPLSPESFDVCVDWFEEGCPRPTDPSAIQLDLDRLVRIRALIKTHGEVGLREARATLSPEGWSARDVRLALEALAESGEVVSDNADDRTDPHFSAP